MARRSVAKAATGAATKNQALSTGRDQSGRRPVRQDVGAPPPHLHHGPQVQTKGEPDQEAAGGEGAGEEGGRAP